MTSTPNAITVPQSKDIDIFRCRKPVNAEVISIGGALIISVDSYTKQENKLSKSAHEMIGFLNNYGYEIIECFNDNNIETDRIIGDFINNNKDDDKNMFIYIDGLSKMEVDRQQTPLIYAINRNSVDLFDAIKNSFPVGYSKSFMIICINIHFADHHHSGLNQVRDIFSSIIESYPNILILCNNMESRHYLSFDNYTSDNTFVPELIKRLKSIFYKRIPSDDPGIFRVKDIVDNINKRDIYVLAGKGIDKDRVLFSTDPVSIFLEMPKNRIEPSNLEEYAEAFNRYGCPLLGLVCSASSKSNYGRFLEIVKELEITYEKGSSSDWEAPFLTLKRFTDDKTNISKRRLRARYGLIGAIMSIEANINHYKDIKIRQKLITEVGVLSDLLKGIADDDEKIGNLTLGEYVVEDDLIEKVAGDSWEVFRKLRNHNIKDERDFYENLSIILKLCKRKRDLETLEMVYVEQTFLDDWKSWAYGFILLFTCVTVASGVLRNQMVPGKVIGPVFAVLVSVYLAARLLFLAFIKKVPRQSHRYGIVLGVFVGACSGAIAVNLMIVDIILKVVIVVIFAIIGAWLSIYYKAKV